MAFSFTFPALPARHMLLLPRDVSAVNGKEAEVYRLSEWRCVVCDAINVLPLRSAAALGPQSPILIAPFE